MANLSGQTIQSTYPGLLNLNTATTGITSTPQAITDGYGNNTGIDIAIDYLAAPNILNYPSRYSGDYGGTGFGVGSAANQANSQNRLIYGFLWDSGIDAYSALTYNLQTLTSTSDVVDFYLYTLQIVPGYGYAPKDLIYSGTQMTSTGSTGVKTTALASNVSFSGYGGGGFYIYAFNVQNSNVTPTVRYTTRTFSTGTGLPPESMGYYLTNAGTSIVQVGKTTPAAGLTVLNTVRPNYTEADIATDWSSVTAVGWGIALNTVR